MNTEDVLNEFRDAGALREGHFVLSSGLHSPVFLQKNLVFMDGARCARLCKALAEKIVATVGPVDAAISSALRLVSRRLLRHGNADGRMPRFSSSVRFETSVKCWCTIPIPERRACSGRRNCTGSPLTDISPSSGW